MGIGIFLFDSGHPTPGRFNSQRIYVFEEDMEAILEGLTRTMQIFADPARRRNIGEDLGFGVWLAAYQPELRPFLDSGCEQAPDQCPNIVVSPNEEVPVGELGIAWIDVANPDCIMCWVKRDPFGAFESSEPPTQEVLEFNIRVYNTYDPDGGREVHTVYRGPGVEVSDYVNLDAAARATAREACPDAPAATGNGHLALLDWASAPLAQHPILRQRLLAAAEDLASENGNPEPEPRRDGRQDG
ncbi:hypothetical protein TgHK011_009963 [Trichoderma gracile]|nr:hypothetical protein TgHK011_009963 [Trichoderma gracile]